MTILAEKAYLQQKIQHMMCNIATPEQLREQQKFLGQLKRRLEVAKQANSAQHEIIDDNEKRFVGHIYGLFEQEVKANEKNAKRKKELLILGKWYSIVILP
jgi:hypothetical protein